MLRKGLGVHPFFRPADYFARADCHAALMGILESFVRVGWPDPHQLTYRLSEIYR